MVAGKFEFVEGTTPTTTPDTGEWYLYFKSGGLYVKDDTGTETNIVSIEGTQDINIPASDMYPSTTAGCAVLAQVEFITNDVDIKVLDFDQTTQEYAQFVLFLPDNYGGGTLTYRGVWTAAAGTGDVIWSLQGRAYTNDDAIDQAWGTAISVTDTLIATGDIHITAESAALTLAGTPAGGQLAVFRVYRDADDAGDTLTADARLIAIKLTYTKG